MAPKAVAPKKTTFDFSPEVARKLNQLKDALVFELGFPPSEATGVAIISALILGTNGKQVATLLKKGSSTR